jgi:hypothetical protein
VQEPPTRRSFDRTIMIVVVVALVILLGAVILMRALAPPLPPPVFHAAAIYDTTPRDRLFTPFGLHIDPMERRMYFMRYSPDPLVATLNPSFDGRLAPLTLDDGEAHADDGVVYDLLENHGRLELQRLRRAHGEHEVRIDFMPPFPDLVGLADGVQVSGSFVVHADPSLGTVAGDYRVDRAGDGVTVRLVPSDGWTPNERLLSVRLMYTLVPLFRGWPTTYLWTAVIDVADPAAPRMRSWRVRTGTG